MAYKRRKVASILKGKDGAADYIKVSEDVTLKAGSFLNLESKKSQLESLESARDKMSEENFEKAQERINKMPDFVRFEIIQVTKD